MNKKKLFQEDIVNAIKYGVIIGGIFSVIFILGGCLFGGFRIIKAIEIWRGGMCIVSGLTLFLVAGIILTKKSEKIVKDSPWRKKFKILSYSSVIGIASIIFIMLATVADFAMRLFS